MKPTLQQEEILKKYLREALLYLETYEEVYDHILAAIEQKPVETSFQNAVNEILNEDFGGSEGLAVMEKRSYKSIVNETLGQQYKYFKSYFKFPGLVYTIILFVTLYLIVSKINNASFIVLFLVFSGVLVPGFLMLMRYYWIGYFTMDTKKSIKDKIMGQIASKCSSFITLIMLFLSNKKDFNINAWIVDYTTIFSLALTVFVMFVFSFIKLNNDEFKIYKAG